jgi:arylsulfatase A-like enzyme
VIGKWHLADDDKILPGKRGFDMAMIGYMLAGPLNKMNPYFPQTMRREDGSEVRFPENSNVDDQYVWSYGPSAGREDARTRMYDAEGRFKDKLGNTQVTYSEDVYREAALAFLRANRDKPFFLYYATPLVHSPIGVKNLGRFKETPADWDLNPKASTTFPRILWAAMVEELDHSVGLLIDELHRLGLEKDTLVFFASDNGYACWGNWNTGGRWVDDPFFQHKGPWDRGKFVNANGGLIVPFIVSWPGTIAPGKTDRAVCFYDFMATCAELANAQLPGPTDGVSLVALLTGHNENQPLRSAIMWPKEAGNGAPDPESTDPRRTYPLQSILLDERWFAYSLIGSPSYAERPIRLFDVRHDPGCQRDRSGDEAEFSDRALRSFRQLKQ